jgi:hypothetical protein
MASALLRALQRHRVPSPVTQVELVPPQGVAADAGAEARKALGHVSIFENILRPEQLDALVAVCEERALRAAKAFIRQGENGTSMF